MANATGQDQKQAPIENTIQGGARKMALRPDVGTQTGVRLLTLADCARVHEADNQKAQRVANRIHSILASTMYAAMNEVGQVLLEEFYGGSEALYRSSSHEKPVSLRCLEAMCENGTVKFKHTFLANSVGVALMVRRLGEPAAYLRLCPSHQVELLRLREPARVQKLTEVVAAKRHKVTEVRELVDAELGKTGRRRRPSELSIALGRCEQAVLAPKSAELRFKAEQLSLAPEEAAGLARRCQRLQVSLEQIERLLAAHAGEQRNQPGSEP